MSDEFDGAIEAGSKAAVVDSLLDTLNLDDLRLAQNSKYNSIIKECKLIHNELLKQESAGKLGNFVENPSLIGDYLGRLRLNANQLFTFMNIYIDILSDLEREYAARRQQVYETKLAEPKSSPSAAQNHARELTRVDESKIKVIENMIQQVKNEYERFNGICMYLQSRMKEFNTERMVG